MDSSYHIGHDLAALVSKTYRSALAASKVVYTASDEVSVVRTSSGLRFQLRFCSSLAKKPTAHDDKHDQSRPIPKRENPFASPDPDMVIAHLPPDAERPSHSLILNKFPIIAEHFMLITKEAKEQTHRLEVEDIEAVYAVLKAWSGHRVDGRGGGLFAFFNSGPHSGASQAHRHVQFLPVDSMREGLGDQDWTLLLDDLPVSQGCDSKLRAQYALRGDFHAQDGPGLHAHYEALLDKAEGVVDEYIRSKPGVLELHDTSTGSSAFSYNLGMALNRMAIFPRRSDGMRLSKGEAGIGYACLNGTLLGGSLMVKKQEEFDCLKSTPGIMDRLLETIGIPLQENKDEDSRSCL